MQMKDVRNIQYEMASIVNKNAFQIYASDEWLDISSMWQLVLRIGEMRDEQKRMYSSTKNWSKHSTHSLGVAGEVAFYLHTGLHLNYETILSGDGSVDFIYSDKTIDIKSTQYWKDPELKQYMKPKYWCDYYVLVSVDFDGKKAKVCGHIKSETLKNASIKNFGHGDQRSVNHTELEKGLPPFLPKNSLMSFIRSIVSE